MLDGLLGDMRNFLSVNSLNLLTITLIVIYIDLLDHDWCPSYTYRLVFVTYISVLIN